MLQLMGNSLDVLNYTYIIQKNGNLFLDLSTLKMYKNGMNLYFMKVYLLLFRVNFAHNRIKLNPKIN